MERLAERTRRWLSRRFTKHAIILGYHRIADASLDPFDLCVSPMNFADHLRVLQHVSSPISLSELIDGLERRRIPDKSVVITFDDGYSDLLENAIPLLKRYIIPATVFVVADELGKRFWWDRLESILFVPGLTPEQLKNFISYLTFHHHVEGIKHDFDAGSSENVRIQFLQDIYDKFRRVDPGERDRMIIDLETRIGTDNSLPRPSLRALSKSELIELAGYDEIEIGSHTLSHPWLADLSSQAQRNEIFGSKVYLETLLDRTVTSLSYPNGSVSEEAISIVKQAGYQCACTSKNYIVGRNTNPFLLPRFWPPNWDGSTFERWLRKWI